MKKTVRIFYAAWMVIACSAASSTPCIANSAVTIKPDVELNRYAVRLSDLFAGVPVEIDRDIAQAPAPCKPALYNEMVLNKLAQTYRLDWQAQPNADHVTVTSSCTRISNDMVRDAVIARIKADSSTKDRVFDVAFDARNMEIDLPSNQAPDFKLENFTYDPTNKQFRADLTAQTPRGPYVHPITGHVMVKRSVPILAHRVEAGTTLAASDLDWVQIPEERVTSDVVTEPTQLIGRELRRDTAEGDLLRAHDVIPPRLVTRGSLVTLKIETPFISITSQGKSQQDGAEGEVVRVTNTQSNRIVEGVVTAPGVVEIRTSQKLASAQ
jgi:flagella basal body P-ring formation protein FlgA